MVDEILSLSDEEKKEIVDRIAQLPELSGSSNVTVYAAKPQRNLVTPLLLVLVVFGSFLTCFGIYKNHQSVDKQVDLSQQLIPVNKKFSNNDNRLSQIEENIKSVNQKVDTLNHKVWVLGIAHNENAWISQQHDKKDSFVFVTKDWHFSKAPIHLDLSEAEKQKIINSVEH